MATNKLTLPWPPSVNHMYINRRGSYQRIKTATAISYYQTVAALASGRMTHSGPIALTIRLYPPDNRRRDIDNGNKAILDSLTKAGLWEDDCQITEMHSYKMKPDKEYPRVEIISQDLA